MDACGAGELPDAAAYGDTGSATVPNLARSAGGLDMPTCQRLGLGNIVAIAGVPPASSPEGSFGRMAEKSPGKDSTSGHWEIGGLILERPFPLFPDGFPKELVREFEQAAGVETIGNIAASGTEIIERLGREHLETKRLILYTSADSVFQLAAHERLYPPERLYEICQTARHLLTGGLAVGRVIARPFVGEPGNFTRTTRRKDFSLPPPSDTILDHLLAGGRKVLAIGKIYDLFAGRGITTYLKTVSNAEVMSTICRSVQQDRDHHLIFANCVDFDMLWGHRNDEAGFAKGLEDFDRQLSGLLPLLRKHDLLIITADHGCDPTIKTSTDHSREYVPLLVYGRNARPGVDLGTRETFADVAATVAEAAGLGVATAGHSFLGQITRRD